MCSFYPGTFAFFHYGLLCTYSAYFTFTPRVEAYRILASRIHLSLTPCGLFDHPALMDREGGKRPEVWGQKKKKTTHTGKNKTGPILYGVVYHASAVIFSIAAFACCRRIIPTRRSPFSIPCPLCCPSPTLLPFPLGPLLFPPMLSCI